MHTLDLLSRATGVSRFNRWARELAATAHEAFTLPAAERRPARMVWKMSIDLRRPLVTSMGQHDPLDGYITVVQLHTTAAKFPSTTDGPDLTEAIRQFRDRTAQGDWTSPDPLGIGGLLVDAYRVAQLRRSGGPIDGRLLARLLCAALAGLRYYTTSDELQAPAEYLLAFRELGLVIGLQAVERLWRQSEEEDSPVERGIRTQLQALRRYIPLSEQIRSYWWEPSHRSANIWREHRDINEVMLATSLAPDGFLELIEIVYESRMI
jgi:hypothetical protein